MIINKEEVEKAAENYCNIQNIYPSDTALSKEVFIAGALLVESKVQEYVGDIIIENQGLKLYKDNEADRFKELAIELVHLMNNKEIFYYINNEFGIDKLPVSAEKLCETFLKEKNEKN